MISLLFWFAISTGWQFRGVSYVEETTDLEVKVGNFKKVFRLVK